MGCNKRDINWFKAKPCPVNNIHLKSETTDDFITLFI